MKKISSCNLVAVFVVLSMSNDMLAQKSPVLARVDALLPQIKTLSVADEVQELRRNEINIKAQRDLSEVYKNVCDVKWVKSANGLLAAYFTNAGIVTRRYYNRKGRFEYMIRYYKEDKLSRSIRHLVKSTYYDCSIEQVTEVTWKDLIVYITKLQDDKSWKTVRVADNEIELVDQYSKL